MITVWQRPPRITRSPGIAAVEDAGPLARLQRGELARGPSRFAQNGTSAACADAGHRVLVDPVESGEHPAGDRMLVARRGDDHQPVDLPQRREVGRDRAHRRFVVEQHDRAAVAAAAEEQRALADSQRAAAGRGSRPPRPGRREGRAASKSPSRLTVSMPDRVAKRTRSPASSTWRGGQRRMAAQSRPRSSA